MALSKEELDAMNEDDRQRLRKLGGFWYRKGLSLPNMKESLNNRDGLTDNDVEDLDKGYNEAQDNDDI